MIARLFGYLIVKKKKAPLDVHMYVANLLDQLSVNCVIDVGANVGQYGKALRENGFKGHIYYRSSRLEKIMTRWRNTPARTLIGIYLISPWEARIQQQRST